MPDAAGVRAGGAFIELTTKDAFSKGLADAKKKLVEFGGTLKEAGQKFAEIGAVGLVGFGTAVGIFTSVGSALKEMSERTGVSVEALSQLKYAAGQVGVDGEALSDGLTKMQRALVEAGEGSKESKEALGQLGLSLGDVMKLSPDKQFELISDRLSKVADPAIRANAAMTLFGRGGAELLPLMNQGAAGIEAMRQRCDQLGLTVSGPAAEAAENLSRSFNDLWAITTKVAFEIGGALAPELQALLVPITTGAVAVEKFVQEHQGLVLAAAGVTLGVTVMGGALIGTGYALIGLGSLFGVATTAVGIFGTAVGIVGGTLLSPFVLLGAAVAGIGGYFLYTSGAAGKAFAAMKGGATSAAGGVTGVFNEVWSYLKSVWDGLKSDALESFSGIRSALSAGDWGTAAQILWTVLQLEWAKGINALHGKWSEVKQWFGETWNNAIYGALEEWYIVTGSIQGAWTDLTADLTKVWVTFGSAVESIWDKVTKAVSDKMLDAQGAAGLMSPEDVAAAKKLNDKQSQDNQHRIQQDESSQLRAADANRAGKVKAAQDELNRTLEALATANQQDNAKLKGAGDKEVGALQQKVLDLKKQLDQLAAKAAGEKKDGGSHLPELPDFKKLADGGGDDAATSASPAARAAQVALVQPAAAPSGGSTHTISMFGGDAGYGMGAALGPEDRTAQATEATAKNTAALLNKSGKGSDQISQSAQEQNQRRKLTTALGGVGAATGGVLGAMLGGGAGAAAGAATGAGVGGFLQSILGQQNFTGAAASFDQMKTGLGLQSSKGTDPKSGGDVHAGGTSAIVAAIHQTNEHLQKLIRKPHAQFA